MTSRQETTSSVLSKADKRRKAIFDEQFVSFWGGVGSTVRFKHNGVAGRIEWDVIGVETDWRAVKWTKGGKRPLFIKLQRKVSLAGGKHRVETCWTFTEALKEPEMKGRWYP